MHIISGSGQDNRRSVFLEAREENSIYFGSHAYETKSTAKCWLHVDLLEARMQRYMICVCLEGQGLFTRSQRQNHAKKEPFSISAGVYMNIYNETKEAHALFYWALELTKHSHCFQVMHVCCHNNRFTTDVVWRTSWCCQARSNLLSRNSNINILSSFYYCSKLILWLKSWNLQKIIFFFLLCNTICPWN